MKNSTEVGDVTEPTWEEVLVTIGTEFWRLAPDEYVKAGHRDLSFGVSWQNLMAAVEIAVARCYGERPEEAPATPATGAPGPTNFNHVTVAQLRTMLNELPHDAVVILAKDAEGNAYSPLSRPIESAWYVPNSTWSGEVYPIGEDADGDVYQTDGSELLAVVLDPTN